MAQEQFGGKNKGEGLGHSAQEFKSQVKDQAEKSMERARETMSNVGEQANTGVAAVGGQMKDLAERLRERVPQEGMIGTAAETVARSLETGGEYLEEHDLRDIAEDVSGVVRSYPIPSVLACVGLGFLIGRVFRS